MSSSSKNPTRRTFLQVTAASAVAAGFGRRTAALQEPGAAKPSVLRWGVVGTGMIANSMAGAIKGAKYGELVAVSSRRMETANAYAEKHKVTQAFDSWENLAQSDQVDAIYVATPTSVREEICIAAARGGKHVLGEKPLASLASVDRILAACHENDVAFMDGTHFSHHPRTWELRKRRKEWIGDATLLDSSFAFNLRDRSNIRYNTELEPMGAIGDAGWYNMRAAAEYLPMELMLEQVHAELERDKETGAVLKANGELFFAGGVRSTWTCGFDAPRSMMDVRMEGPGGEIKVPGFLFQDRDNSARLIVTRGKEEPKTHRIASDSPGSVLMFEDMAAAAADPKLRPGWEKRTRRTQALLDAIWKAAIQAEAAKK